MLGGWKWWECCVGKLGPSKIGFRLGCAKKFLKFCFQIYLLSSVFIFALPNISAVFNETLGENVTTEITVPVVSPTDLRKNSDYSRDYVLITNSVALGFIPMVGLVVLNSLIFRTINQATQRHNAISSNQRRDHSVSS